MSYLNDSSAPTNLPTATTSISAVLQTAARSLVLLWQIVTVACAHLSSSDTGVPTMALRPTTTAVLPATWGEGMGEVETAISHRPVHCHSPSLRSSLSA